MIDLVGREVLVLAISRVLIALLYLAMLAVALSTGLNELGLAIILSLYLARRVIGQASLPALDLAIKGVSGGDRDVIQAYYSLRQFIGNVVSAAAGLATGYALYVSVELAGILVLANALLALTSTVPLALMRFRGRGGHVGVSLRDVINRGFGELRRLLAGNVALRALVLIIVVSGLSSAPALALEIFDYYYDAALLFGLLLVTVSISNALGSLVTPSFRFGRLGDMKYIVIAMPFTGFPWGFMPLLTDNPLLALPILYATVIIANVLSPIVLITLDTLATSASPADTFGVVRSTILLVISLAQSVGTLTWAYIGTLVGAPKAILLAMTLEAAALAAIVARYGGANLR